MASRSPLIAPDLRGIATLVAMASLVAILIFYGLPVLAGAGIQWRTMPYGARSEYRLPGYLWPPSVIALYAFSLVPAVFPRRLLSPAVVALGRASLVLATVLSLLLVAWLVVTPMFS
jgi:hypothetical protein